MQRYYVGKNVVRILNREFPVDKDLSMITLDQEVCAWHVGSQREDHQFIPLSHGDVSIETFQTYRRALNTSIAFNKTGKIRQMFERKEKGVKIIPGHGVFMLPSKMTVVPSGQRKIKVRVFSGTSLSQDFQLENYSHMVASASEYYRENFRQFTDEVNESLYFPVMYSVHNERVYEGLDIPQGVCVRQRDVKAPMEVYYKHSTGTWQYVGSSRNLIEIKNIIEIAVAKRRAKLAITAIYRFVAPKFIQLSDYMKAL